MTARMRRLASDWEQVKKDFTGHQNIIVTPMGEEPYEKYHITYFVNGIYLLQDGRIETLARHEVEITLHADYPRYKPLCKILTPIWHPNFRDGQICIGDIWGAGESLSDIIINIGDMIQYKSWNSYSPLSADAAQWAMENKHLFPVGNVELYIADYASAKDTVEIDLFDEAGEVMEDAPTVSVMPEAAPEAPAAPVAVEEKPEGNDFEITAEELEGIEFVPTAQRMQTVSHGGMVKGGKINFKTILVKGLLWAIIGAFLGFGVTELIGIGASKDNAIIADIMGYSYLSDYYEYEVKADEAFGKAYSMFTDYCDDNSLDPDGPNVFKNWLNYHMSSEAEGYLDDYSAYDDISGEALYDSYQYEFDSDEDALFAAQANITRTSTAIWFGLLALFIGLFLGLGEGIFYGSVGKAFKYAAIGAGISLGIGFFNGYIAQWMYSEMLSDSSPDLVNALVRGIGWAVMGLGVGASVGLIKPAPKRILFCLLGGAGGGFIGGFLFNYITTIEWLSFGVNDTGILPRAIGIVIMGSLIGLGIGLLEQFAKQAWLKVIRGEFEGKEYLVFAGTTSIGNNGKNTIVLFKDKLVGPHHCDIVLEGSKYVLHDCGTPMGTVVNGMRTTRHILRKGDAIAIGNSVLVFNTK